MSTPAPTPAASPVPGTPPTLIYNPDRGFTTWNIKDIYNPVTNATAQYVPNVNDMVIDWNSGFYRVSAVDPSSGISTLSPWSPAPSSVPGAQTSLLLGDMPGVQYERFRVYLNTTVLPHSLQCDAALHLYGTTVSYIKIFRGSDISANGQVVSQWYDNAGNLLGENIPTELCLMPDANNIAIQTPKVGYTLTQMSDGELVTIVAYRADGGPCFTAPALVVNTGAVRSTDASLKYITSIAVETPFLSQSDPSLIQYPINMPVEELNLMGVVTYSDGTVNRIPVDGTKFAMLGLQQFVSTIIGQQVGLSLRYTLSPGEQTYGSTSANPNFITKPYTATTIAQVGAYSVKLFPTPVWQDPIAGYRLDWWMYTLDRDLPYNVTGLVQAAQNSAAFNPTLYATTQQITVAINMSQVDPKFANWRHVQTFAVNLLARGDTQGQTDWSIAYAPGQNPPYGIGVQALLTMVNQNLWSLDLTSGFNSMEEWLRNLYQMTLPLYNVETESAPPTPNYFALIVGGQRVEIPVTQWNQPVQLAAGIAEGQPVYLQFFERTQANDLQLGVAGMIVHNVTPPA